MALGTCLAVILISLAHLDQRVCLLEVQDRGTDAAIIHKVGLRIPVPPPPHC